MACKNSLKIYLEKYFFSSRAAASLLARLPKPAQHPPRIPAFASAQLDRRGPVLPRAVFSSRAPRPTASGTPRRVASACRRRRPGGVPWPPRACALPIFKPPQLRFSLHSSFPLPRCLSASPRTELCSRRHRHRSPTGKIGRRWSTIARNRAHVAPPRSPTPSARCRVIV